MRPFGFYICVASVRQIVRTHGVSGCQLPGSFLLSSVCVGGQVTSAWCPVEVGSWTSSLKERGALQ